MVDAGEELRKEGKVWSEAERKAGRPAVKGKRLEHPLGGRFWPLP